MAKAKDLIENGSFEHKKGWTINDPSDPQYFATGVYRLDDKRITHFDERFGFGYAAPEDAKHAFYTDWDGGPGHITLGQDVDLGSAKSATLSFAYEAAWDLKHYNAKADRTFSVQITDHKTGHTDTTVVLTAHKGEFETDTGLQHFDLDMSAYAGHKVTVEFVWDAPGDFDGPAIFMLDDVKLLAGGKGPEHAVADLHHASEPIGLDHPGLVDHPDFVI